MPSNAGPIVDAYHRRRGGHTSTAVASCGVHGEFRFDHSSVIFTITEFVECNTRTVSRAVFEITCGVIDQAARTVPQSRPNRACEQKNHIPRPAFSPWTCGYSQRWLSVPTPPPAECLPLCASQTRSVPWRFAPSLPASPRSVGFPHASFNDHFSCVPNTRPSLSPRRPP